MAALRWLFAMIVGLAVGFGVSMYVSGPKWQCKCDDEAHDPFVSADGKTLFTGHGLWPKSGVSFRPRLKKWDIASGELLGEMAIDWPDANIERCLDVMPIPGDQRLLISSPFQINRKTWVYYVYDSNTGQRLTGPINTDYSLGRYVTRRGHWYVVPRDNHRGLDIFDLNTQELVGGMTSPPDLDCWAISLSPDGDKFAVLQRAAGTLIGRRIQVHEFPSGRELRQLELPEREWLNMGRWESDGRVQAIWCDRVGESNTSYRGRSVSFSMKDEDFGTARDEAVRDYSYPGNVPYTKRCSGHGWLVKSQYVNDAKPTLVEKVSGWFSSITGINIRPSKQQTQVHTTIIDPTSHNVVAHMPLTDYPTIVSIDGRYLVSGGTTIRVWSIPPRGSLWGVIAGTISALGLLFVGRRRKLRALA